MFGSIARRAALVSPDRPERCGDLVCLLGPLAPWIVADDVLESAATHFRKEPHCLPWTQPPTLPGGPGTAPVLFALRWNLTAFRAGFVLPLRWTRAEPAIEGRLPRGLVEVAEQAREALNSSEAGTYRLVPDPEAGLGTVNLGDWPLSDCGSAFATLVAALAAVLLGVAPRQGELVLATAARGPAGRLTGVSRATLPDKVGEACRLRATALFVAASDVAAAEASRPDGSTLEIVPIPGGEDDPHRALVGYFEAVGAPPGLTAPLAARVRYHERILANAAQRNRFYERAILPDIGEASSPEGWPSGRALPPALLVSFLSLNPFVAISLCLRLRPRRALLLHTKESERHCGVAEEWLRRVGVEMEPHLVPDMADLASITTTVTGWLDQRDAAPEQTCFDVCAGPGTSSAGLALAAPPGSALVYLEHTYNPSTGRSVPGTERLRGWIKREVALS